jgi:hypothetical protein
LGCGSFDYRCNASSPQAHTGAPSATDNPNPVTPNIEPIQPFTGSPSGRSVTPLRGAGDFSAALSRAEAVAKAGGDPAAATPPPELAAHIAAASRAWDSLAASGRHIAFDQDQDGRVQIQLHDDGTAQWASVAPAALFDLIDQEGGE